MAFKIQKQDKRPSVQLTLTIPASLHDDLGALSQANDSELKYVAVQLLAHGCEENRKEIDTWKSSNPTTEVSKESTKTSGRKSQKTSDVTEIVAA